MTTVRRAITVVMVAAGLAVFGGAAAVHAQTTDEQFEEAVSSLGINAGPETDIPAMGRTVCDTMTQRSWRKTPTRCRWYGASSPRCRTAT